MAQKSKAASLTPDLLTSKSALSQSTPRKQSTDLSLAPPPTASPPGRAKAATLPPAKADGDEPPPARADGVEPAHKSDPEQAVENAPTARPRNDVGSAPPPSVAAVADTVPAKSNGGDDNTTVADEQSKAGAFSDYRIRIPVPLDPSEHLQLTLAAARSGRSCQEIIVEALFRYLEDVAGPPDRPAAPGPDGR